MRHEMLAIADLSGTPLTLFIIWIPLSNLLLQHFQNTVPCFFHQSFMECVSNSIHFRFGNPLITNAVSIIRFISAIIVKYGTRSRATGDPPYIARGNWLWFQFFKIVLIPKLKKVLFIARQHTDARYWYSNFVCPSVCPPARYVPVFYENGLTCCHHVMVSSPHDSPIILVSWVSNSLAKFPRGHPPAGN